MLIPRQCVEIGPQCPIGQERGYKLGWYQGQIAMTDEHDGTPCQIIAMHQQIHSLKSLLIEADKVTRWECNTALARDYQERLENAVFF